MGKRSVHKRNQPSRHRFSWYWLALVGMLLLIAGGVVVWGSSRNRPVATPEMAGAPKLVVDQIVVDEGYLQYNVPVRTTFRLTNVGDQPLKVLGSPVELAEGC
jgi:hypothetical protein